jgi:hypothetical protein
MAQIKIEITYDPSTETLAQAVSSLVPSTAGIDPDALGEAVTQEALARLGKTTGKAAQTNEVKAEGADPTCRYRRDRCLCQDRRSSCGDVCERQARCVPF